MDFIGLVKDSFEAVVQEVESACQRKPASDRQNGNEAAAESASDVWAASPNQESPTEEEAPTIECATQTAAAETSTKEPASEPAETQPTADMNDQLQLLADTMRQASIQLSAAAVVGTVPSAEEMTSESLDKLRQEQAELRKLFESRIHSDQVQSRALERLHEELKGSREQLKRAELAPVLKDIIFCHDFVAKELQHDAAGGEPDWRKSFDLLGQMLLDVLFKYDVEPFSGESDEFDRSCQQCVKTEATKESEQDRRIASVGLSGFRNEDRIIRREQVTVFRYRPSG
jgi:molecular chaperone GrpE (heat shock protein)